MGVYLVVDLLTVVLGPAEQYTHPGESAGQGEDSVRCVRVSDLQPSLYRNVCMPINQSANVNLIKLISPSLFAKKRVVREVLHLVVIRSLVSVPSSCSCYHCY